MYGKTKLIISSDYEHSAYGSDSSIEYYEYECICGTVLDGIKSKRNNK